ncbi:MAG TPA: leishmanolysin-related zinc metalloendopeptidase, partial [Longimicrobiales bacterium]|nr:leishmanolysin-related zinc metalloendopeptidase [Longimicrobiales bacterium]
MTAMLRVPGRTGVLLAIVMGAAACGDGEAPPVATALQAATTTPATAVVGSPLTAGVKVLDEKSRPMKGVSVSFEVTGGGTVAVSQATTDATGVASSEWRLSTATGTNTLVARSGGLAPLTFTVNATADAASNMQAAPDNVTSGVAGAVLNPAPGVRLTDRHGNPVQGVQVSFSSGSGVVLGAQQTSDVNGMARPASWTLGGPAGIQTLTAISGAMVAAIGVTVLPGPPTLVQPFAGNFQAGDMGSTLPVRPAVRVSDAYNNPIAGVTVVFTVATGGGTITGSPTMSDGNGIATAGFWTLGPEPGLNTLTASLPNGSSTTLSATAVNPSALIMERFTGDGTTCPVSTNSCSFTVVVKNGLGDPVPGETVVWSNGAQTQTMTTNMRGRATATNLVTDATPQSAQQRARLESTGADVTFNYQLVQPGGYNIELRFVGTAAPSVQGLFVQVRQRWEQVITGNLSSVQMNAPAGTCAGVAYPALNEVIDDLVIYVQVTPIDGPGGVLGRAGPCWIRSTNSLPVVGGIRLDSADLALMEANGTLQDVLVHEMGHVLGIGAQWGPASQGGFDLLQGAGGSDPYFTGARAVSYFQLTGGVLVNGVPVENSGGEGTRDGHWRETTFARELMTGFINSGGANPLSVITIGSLLDMGYQVNFGAADAYLMPGTSVFGIAAEGHSSA